MKPLDITTESFDRDVLHNAQLTIVDFWAPWCGPCKMIAPVLDEIAARYEGKAKIAKLNVEEYSDTSQRYGVTSIPTLIFIRDGEVVDRISGAVSRSQLESRINRLLDVPSVAKI